MIFMFSKRINSKMKVLVHFNKAGDQTMVEFRDQDNVQLRAELKIISDKLEAEYEGKLNAFFEQFAEQFNDFSCGETLIESKRYQLISSEQFIMLLNITSSLVDVSPSPLLRVGSKHSLSRRMSHDDFLTINSELDIFKNSANNTTTSTLASSPTRGSSSVFFGSSPSATSPNPLEPKPKEMPSENGFCFC